MNAVVNLNTSNTVVTMSTKEIADLTGKRHDNVVRDVRKMLGSLDINALSFEGVYTDGKGEARPCFNLPRDLTETLITGYNVPLRHKVVVRLRELEEAKAKPVNLSDASSLRTLLLGYTKQVLQLEHKLGEAAPAIEFYQDTGDTKDLQSVNAVARTLNSGQNRLFAYMRKHKIMLSEGDHKNLPMQQHQDAGHFKF